MYAFFTARLCEETGCGVFAGDYRLAPEFRFPAAIEDAGHVVAALREAGTPSERVIVAGDGGGAGVANTLVLAAPQARRARAARRRGAVLPRGRPTARSAVDRRQRRMRHPAVERPDRTSVHGVDPAQCLGVYDTC